MNEELAQYQERKSLEEIADLLEVIQAVGAIGIVAGGEGRQDLPGAVTRGPCSLLC